MTKRWFILILTGLLSFTLQAQNLEGIGTQKPFTFHGSIGTNIVWAQNNVVRERDRPLSFILTGNCNASVYGLSLPFSFSLSNKQRNYSQPFNQFGMSPSYKWITVHAGYRNVRFSDFTLSGHTFAGGGVELNPGKFRFGFITGRFRRSSYTNHYSPTIDSLPEYKRNGTAIKIGVGGKKSFVDLIVLRIHDDTSSLKSINRDYPNRTPEQNFVTGLNTKVTLSRSLIFEGEGAVSIYTSNMFAAKYDSSNTPIINKVANIILINQSTQWFTAVRTALIYKTKSFSTKFEFRRIDPGYTSMGAYYFNSDLQNLTVSPTFAIWKRKLQVRGSLGLQRDNLRNTKKATSLRTIGMLGVSFNPSQVFGVDAQFSNFSTNQKAGRSPITDTTKVYQATQSISVSPRLTFMNSTRSQMIMLMLNRNHLNDNNPVTQNLTENTATIANLNYILSIIESKLSMNAGLTYLSMKNVLSENKSQGFTVGVSKMMAKETLSLNWSNSLMFTNYMQNTGKVFTSSIGLNYRLKKHHQFQLNTFFTGNFYPKASTVQSFNEIKGDMSYVFTF